MLVPLMPPEPSGEEDTGAVDGEQGADTIELGREDSQNDESEGELRQRRADVCPFERPLGGPDFNQLLRRQDHGSSAVESKVIPISCVWLHAVSDARFGVAVSPGLTSNILILSEARYQDGVSC